MTRKRRRLRVITFRVYRPIGLINRALNVPRENRYRRRCLCRRV